MSTKQIVTVEQQLLSKQAIQLPARERLALLLQANRYPIVRKGTSAERQIKEMINLYNLYCLMLTRYFPSEEAEEKYILLNWIATLNINNAKLKNALQMVKSYEEVERRITQIQLLFNEYRESFPEIYEKYNLEDIVTKQITDIIKDSRELCKDPVWVQGVMNVWDI